MDSLWQPDKVKIGPFDYDVKWFSREEENRNGRYGYTDSNEFEIGVSDRLPAKKKADTFMHEIIHALADIMHLDDKIGEEEIASKFGVALTTFARDNPLTMLWWVKLLEN